MHVLSPPHGLFEDYELAFSPHDQPHTGTPASPGPGDAFLLRPTLVLANVGQVEVLSEEVIALRVH